MEIEVGGPLKFPACRGVAREQGEGMESDMNGINLESEERERERDDDPVDKKLGGTINVVNRSHLCWEKGEFDSV